MTKKPRHKPLVRTGDIKRTSKSMMFAAGLLPPHYTPVLRIVGGDGRAQNFPIDFGYALANAIFAIAERATVEGFLVTFLEHIADEPLTAEHREDIFAKLREVRRPISPLPLVEGKAVDINVQAILLPDSDAPFVTISMGMETHQFSTESARHIAESIIACCETSQSLRETLLTINGLSDRGKIPSDMAAHTIEMFIKYREAVADLLHQADERPPTASTA